MRVYGFLFPVAWGRWQGRQRDAEALAEVDGGSVRGETVGLGPEVQRVAGAAALEAMEALLLKVGGEAAAGAGGGAVQGAGAALLGTVGAVGLEAEQLQDGSQGDRGADGSEVDGRARRGRRWRAT